jgi:hypothetical protein
MLWAIAPPGNKAASKTPAMARPMVRELMLGSLAPGGSVALAGAFSPRNLDYPFLPSLPELLIGPQSPTGGVNIKHA